MLINKNINYKNENVSSLDARRNFNKHYYEKFFESSYALNNKIFNHLEDLLKKEFSIGSDHYLPPQAIIKNKAGRDDLSATIRDICSIYINNDLEKAGMDIQCRKREEQQDFYSTFKYRKEDGTTERSNISIPSAGREALPEVQEIFQQFNQDHHGLIDNLKQKHNLDLSSLKILEFTQKTYKRNIFDKNNPDKPIVTLTLQLIEDKATKQNFYQLKIRDLAENELSRQTIKMLEAKIAAELTKINSLLIKDDIASFTGKKLLEISKAVPSAGSGGGEPPPLPDTPSGTNEALEAVSKNLRSAETISKISNNLTKLLEHKFILQFYLADKLFDSEQIMDRTNIKEYLNRESRNLDSNILQSAQNKGADVLANEFKIATRDLAADFKQNEGINILLRLESLRQLYKETVLTNTFSDLSNQYKALLLSAEFLTELLRIMQRKDLKLVDINKLLSRLITENKAITADRNIIYKQLWQLLIALLSQSKQINNSLFGRLAQAQALAETAVQDTELLQTKAAALTKILEIQPNYKILMDSFSYDLHKQTSIVNSLKNQQVLEVITVWPLILWQLRNKDLKDLSSIVDYQKNVLKLNELQILLANNLVQQFLANINSVKQNIAPDKLPQTIYAYLLFYIINFIREKAALAEKRKKKAEKAKETKNMGGQTGQDKQDQEREKEKEQEKELDPFAIPYYIDTTELSRDNDPLQQIIKTLSHEMLNQLNGITMPLDNIEAGLAQLGMTDPQIAKNMRKAQHNIKLLEELFNNILHPQNNLLSKPTDFNLKKMVQEVKETLGQKLINNQVEVSIAISDILEITGSRSKLKQVLLNMLINAIQAFPPEQELKTVKIKVTGHGKYFTLSITDNGSGIAKEILPKIFDYSFTTKTGTGSGIGLAIAKEIIEEHKGSIEVESTPGEGTTFKINLPI